MTLYIMEYPFGQSGSAAQLVSSPNFLSIPGYPLQGVDGVHGQSTRKRKLWCCASTETAKTLF